MNDYYEFKIGDKVQAFLWYTTKQYEEFEEYYGWEWTETEILDIRVEILKKRRYVGGSREITYCLVNDKNGIGRWVKEEHLKPSELSNKIKFHNRRERSWFGDLLFEALRSKNS